MRAWINQSNKKAALNLVLANAGVATTKENDENVYNTFNTNVFGVLNTVLPAVALFSKRRGKGVKAIAMLSSIAGYHGLAGCPSYSASKACVKAYGEALRVYLAPKDIQISVICPGFVKSRITDKNTCPMPFFKQRRPDCFPLADAAGRLVFIRSAELCQQFHLFQTALQGVTAPAKTLFTQTGKFKTKKEEICRFDNFPL